MILNVGKPFLLILCLLFSLRVSMHMLIVINMWHGYKGQSDTRKAYDTAIVKKFLKRVKFKWTYKIKKWLKVKGCMHVK